MEITIKSSDALYADSIISGSYYGKKGLNDRSLLFKRYYSTSSDDQYNSFSSLVDNMYYQPDGMRNAYELGKEFTDTERISIGNSSYFFDRVPEGVREIEYETTSGVAIYVKFQITPQGLIEYQFDQVVLLKFENADDSSDDGKSPSYRLHKDRGHKFHRAYNAIQYQDDDSIISKLLVAAIFDTYDIDFSKGTLFGCDSSKFFLGNRVKNSDTAKTVIYQKVVNIIIDGDTYEECKGLSIDEVATLLNSGESIGDKTKSSFSAGDLVSFENCNSDLDGYYVVVINSLTSNISFKATENDNVPAISPIYTNEENEEIKLITNSNPLSDRTSLDIFYPPSHGALFEYGKNGDPSNPGYYYVYSPYIQAGYNDGDTGTNYVLAQDILSGQKRLTVMTITKSLEGLNQDPSKWHYTKSGELIVDDSQIKRTYPIL